MHPDLIWLEPPESPDRTIAHGREAAVSTLMLWLSNWANYENELRGVTEHGDQALVHFRQRMVGPGSGVPVEGDLFMVWTVRDGLASRMAMFNSRDEATAELAAG